MLEQKGILPHKRITRYQIRGSLKRILLIKTVEIVEISEKVLFILSTWREPELRDPKTDGSWFPWIQGGDAT